MIKKIKRTREGSAQHAPRIVGEILHDYLENSNEPLAVAYRERTTESEKQSWHSNTDLGCDLKTILRSDVRMKTGKEYQGVLRCDSEASIEDFRCCDPQYIFIETIPLTAGKRNLHVFDGDYITITRRDDGRLRPNFKPMKMGADFSIEKYASGVANELLWALEGLVENGSIEEV